MSHQYAPSSLGRRIRLGWDHLGLDAPFRSAARSCGPAELSSNAAVSFARSNSVRYRPPSFAASPPPESSAESGSLASMLGEQSRTTTILRELRPSVESLSAGEVGYFFAGI